MAKKKPNLAASLAEVPEAVADTPARVPGPSNDRSARTPARQKSREGQANISGWFDMPVKFQLDELRLMLSRDRGRNVTLNQIQAEAYNDIFKKYGMAEIAPGSGE